MMLLVHKDISHMPITEMENNSESVWVKVFANKTSHYVASWPCQSIKLSGLNKHYMFGKGPLNKYF